MHVTLDLPPDAVSVSVARIWVRMFLEEWDLADLADEGVLAVSELVSNAVLHARTPMTVTLDATGPRLRISVSDHAATPVRPRDHAVDAATGRGLQLLDGIAGSWGIDPAPTGKSVWVELGSPRGA